MRREQTAWTDHESSKAVSLWNDGLSITEIAHELNRTRNQVMGHIHRLRNNGAPGILPNDLRAMRKAQQTHDMGKITVSRMDDFAKATNGKKFS